MHALLGAGMYGGLGWLKGASVDPATQPRDFQTFGAGVVVDFTALLLWLSWALGRELVQQRASTQTERVAAVHDLAVYDVRPEPNDAKPFEPYFVAICSCGWLGDVSNSREEAFRNAKRHSHPIDEKVRRPVG